MPEMSSCSRLWAPNVGGLGKKGVTKRTERRLRTFLDTLRRPDPRAWLLSSGPSSMQKFILISILLADVLIPLWAARDPNAIRGLKKALFYMCIFNAMYLLSVMFLYPRL
jgi:hypothetical protein